MNGSLKRLPLLFLFLPGALLTSCFRTPASPPQTTFDEIDGAIDSAQVIVYGRISCQPCDALMQALDEEQISYWFKNIENPVWREEMWQKLAALSLHGAVMIPVVDVNNVLLIQPDLASITQLLPASR